MVPKIHARGTSFRGAAAYLLHDKGRARSSDRVAWTETRNLATEDPHLAWRIMAATAIDRHRLKAAAGVKNTGRKSADVVQHVTLSWHPDEKPGLGREEMVRAGLGALRALGAQDRQVILVCHDDEPQPHLHLLINRVSPADGRLLPSSKEKQHLSRWAEAYEKQRGRVLCEQRVLNNAARDRGEYVRGQADKPRHIHELEAANRARPDLDRVRREQRALDGKLARQRRERAARRQKAWADLVRQQNERLTAVKAEAKRQMEAARQEVRAGFRPAWAALAREHDRQRREFEANEARFLGRMRNAMSAIDLRAILRAGTRARVLGGAFDAIASRGARLEALERVHAKARRRLLARQRAEERKRVRSVRGDRGARVAELRSAAMAERSSLVLTSDMEDAAKRQEWQRRSQQRRAAYERAPAERGDARQLEAEALLEQVRRARENRQNRGRRPRRRW